MDAEPLEFTGERVIPGVTPDRIVRDHVERYRFAARFVRGARVLDVACGTGYGSEILGRGGAAHVIGVDLSAESATYAANHYATGSVGFLVGDATQLGFKPAAFEAVVSFETLEHLPAAGDFLDEVSRVLKPGGVFVCSTPNRPITTNSDDPRAVSTPFHAREFTVGEFLELLRQRRFAVTLYGQRLIPSLLAAPLVRRRFLGRLARWTGLDFEFRIFYLALGPRVWRRWPGFTARYLVAVCRKA